MADPQPDVTTILAALRQGEDGAVDQLFPIVYDQLRVMARQQLRRRRPGQTLDTTALVHEAYLKLVDQKEAAWQDKNHFLSVAAVAMRHILVDYARRRAAQKRGGNERPVTLLEGEVGTLERAEEILAIDEALTALTELSEKLSRVVELRFFGGLTVEETAAVMGTSERTVKRDWRKARAFLYQILGQPAG